MSRDELVCDVLDEMRVDYVKKGTRVDLLCLYHAERNRSAVIYYNDMGYFCFACQARRKLFEVYSYVTGVSLLYAKARCGVEDGAVDSRDSVQEKWLCGVNRVLVWQKWLCVSKSICDSKERLLWEDCAEKAWYGNQIEMKKLKTKIESLGGC